MVKKEPRYSCREYFLVQRIAKPRSLSKEKFDRLIGQKQFKDGPFVEQFGKGYGEPYNPWTQVFGILKDGRGVYCELHSIEE